MPVHHRHLGMQKTGFVLMNFHAGRKQGAVHRPRGVVLHEILVSALQQQDDAHAASGCTDQRAAKFSARHEIGVGNHDLMVRPANGLAVGLLNAVAVAQVVTQDQYGLGTWPGGLPHAGHVRRIGSPAIPGSLEGFPGVA